jgi:hypothetical protein
MKKLAFISVLCLCFILLVSCNSADEPIDIFTDESRPLPSPEEQIANCDHHLGEWKTVGADNCITEGVKARKCKFCPYEESESAFGEHSFVSGKCEFCDRRAPSEGFRFEKDNSNGGYIAFITEDVTDEIIIIPNEHLGKPVTRVDKMDGNLVLILENVREVYIPASVVCIDPSAFQYLTNLTSVNIEEGSTLQKISTGAFRNCTSLVSVSLEKCTRLSFIGGDAFKDCSSLQTMILPENTIELGSEVFMNCAKLKNFEFTGKFQNMGSDVFNGCVSLENINFMNKSSIIGIAMFAGCMGLKNIRIPDSITEIRNRAFSGSGLEHVALPQSLETIDRYAFIRCKSLQTVELNGSFKEIPDSMFYECSSLLEVSGDVVISKIGQKAFFGCTALKVLGFETAGNLRVGTDAFTGCDSLENIP